MGKKIFNPEASYTFRDYFLMAASFPVEDMIAELNYGFSLERLDLPRTNKELAYLSELQNRLERTMPRVNLMNETARREAIIAPILIDAAIYAEAKVRIEYPIEVTPQLKGILDYYLKSQNNLLIVEAKDSDLRRGFVQLATELIALDLANETVQNFIFGAVTTGEEWRFGKLDRADKIITQDVNFYNVPQDLEDLSKILVGILEN